MPATPARLLLLALLLAACGQKPDGTSHGVNPNKHPDGHATTATDTARPDHYRQGMPKGAELNAITNGGTAGTPGHR